MSVTGVSSGSSKTTSYSVMKREKTGAGIFNVGEKTIPTNSSVKYIDVVIPFRIVILFSCACLTILLRCLLIIRNNS